MSGRGYSGDVSALLYLVPFAGAGVYALLLWAKNGLSVTLPSSVYLTVTRDPLLFILGSMAVLLGIIIEVRSTEPVERWAKVLSLSNTIQSIAGASLVLAFLSAVYANGTDIGGAASDFVVGRYGIVFPALLFLLSYLMRIRFQLTTLGTRKFLGMAAMLLVPGALYALGKLKTAADLPAALFFLMVGLILFLWPERKTVEAKGA